MRQRNKIGITLALVGSHKEVSTRNAGRCDSEAEGLAIGFRNNGSDNVE